MSDQDNRAASGGDRPLAMLGRQWWLILLCLLAVPAAALVLSALQPKQYKASAGLLFQATSVVQNVLGAPALSASSDPARDAATHIRQVSSPDVAERTARALGGGLSQTDVARQVEVAGEGESNIVTVTATDRSARFAARLAETYARQFIAFERGNVRSQAHDAQDAIERRLNALPPAQRDGPLGRSLRDRNLQLEILAAASPSDVAFAQHASIPSSPSSPQVKRNVAFGIGLGLLLGLGLALLWERLSDRIRDPAELSALFGRPLLAELPESRAFRDATAAPGLVPTAASEAFRMLRARLRYFNPDRNIGSVMFTGSARGEGKSTIAWHFAAFSALSGMRTVLVEADLRAPSLAASRRLRPGPGLADALKKDVPLDDLVQDVEVSDAADPHDVERLSGDFGRTSVAVIVAGGASSDAPELMESSRMRVLLERLTTEFDLVVLDTPPVLQVSDAIPLISMVDGVLVVVQLGAATRDEARSLSKELASAKAPVIGVVANRVKGRRPRSPYGSAERSGLRGTARSLTTRHVPGATARERRARDALGGDAGFPDRPSHAEALAAPIVWGDEIERSREARGLADDVVNRAAHPRIVDFTGELPDGTAPDPRSGLTAADQAAAGAAPASRAGDGAMYEVRPADEILASLSSARHPLTLIELTNQMNLASTTAVLAELQRLIKKGAVIRRGAGERSDPYRYEAHSSDAEVSDHGPDTSPGT
jgi:tyrosine-protein kinase